MPFINPLNVAEMLVEDLKSSRSTGNQSSSPRTNRERCIMEDLKGLLEAICDSTEFEVQKIRDLVEDVTFSEEKTEASFEDDDEVSGDDFIDVPVSGFSNESVPYEKMKDVVQYWLNEKGKKRRSLSNIQRRYRFVKTNQQLYKFRSYVQKGGTNFQKYKKLDEQVFDRFRDAKNRFLTVHDIDIRQWALEVAKQLGLAEFKASLRWVARFKNRHNIVTRKITQFVTQSDVENQDAIRQSAEIFVATVKEDIRKFGSKSVVNSDQSGIRKAPGSERTLDFKGVKESISTVQNKNAVTHSYTVQPIVNADGDLFSPTLLVLPEISGQFGPRVTKHMFQAPNLKIVATKSGKCDTKTLINWKKEVVDPLTEVGQNVWLLDAFGGFNAAVDSYDNNDDEHDPPTSTFEVRRIPKNTTGLVQPLDVYGFRPVKNFIRRLSDMVMLHIVDFQMGVRDNIKIQSLTWNQLAAKRYKEMWKMGWYCTWQGTSPRTHSLLSLLCNIASGTSRENVQFAIHLP